ncbi:hypothetical protein B0F90DRAFT_206770 [Multifurca ochricompacta]|uniref:Uncharacterized protein n=1 Tax=Multifurca ochricompacta TaxID=376703 RepID=A0AAD4QLM2_9AGAM|nr:hypothetical protein B0F90DRAFT_206770 [Multifurca ochricompacta]
MQRTASHRALIASPGAAFGQCKRRPASMVLLQRQFHCRGRAHSISRKDLPQTSLRVVPPSVAAFLSTVPIADTTRHSSDIDDPSLIYVGPLTQTFRRLKIFSLSSLALASSLSPFIFIVESSLPYTARVALAATALATSGVSTALVAWCGRPYVTVLRRLGCAPTAASPTSPSLDQQQSQQHTTHSHNENAPAGIELTTLTLTLAPRATRVYDPVFLNDTTRAFARWELARSVQLPPEDASSVRPGEEETVAETLDPVGKVLGRWVVTWGENGEGSCRAEGRVETHFNVHEELLTTPIR